MIFIPFKSNYIIHCDYDNVYAPSDDSYLIIDYFGKNVNENYFDGINLKDIEYILDLGTGTGIIAIFLQTLKLHYSNFNPKIYASDILEDAIKCAKLNEKMNKINKDITFLHSDLFISFPESLKNSFNIIIFNPPYLPSSELIKENENKKNIDYSWNGGLKGYEILIKFLKNAKDYLNLTKPHSIYCITSNRTDLDELTKIFNDLGYSNEILEKKHIFFEDILLNRLIFKQ
ncbi:MAG: HemK2/MTQ2 family protein methyltransferase [Promethearchaeota archaeon]